MSASPFVLMTGWRNARASDANPRTLPAVAIQNAAMTTATDQLSKTLTIAIRNFAATSLPLVMGLIATNVRNRPDLTRNIGASRPIPGPAELAIKIGMRIHTITSMGKMIGLKGRRAVNSGCMMTNIIMSKTRPTVHGNTSPWHFHSYQNWASSADRKGRRRADSVAVVALPSRPSRAGQTRQTSPRRSVSTAVSASGYASALKPTSRTATSVGEVNSAYSSQSGTAATVPRMMMVTVSRSQDWGSGSHATA